MENTNVNIRMKSDKLMKFNSFCSEHSTTKEVVINELVDKLLAGSIKLNNYTTKEFNRTSFTNTVCEMLKKKGAEIRLVKYESCTFYVVDEKSVLYFSFRKMNEESLVFYVRGKAIEKLNEYASLYDLTPFAVSFCYAPFGDVWVFSELSLIPEAVPKNKDHSYYLSTTDQTLFYRVAEKNDYLKLNELSKKSLSPELYEVFIRKFGECLYKK